MTKDKKAHKESAELRHRAEKRIGEQAGTAHSAGPEEDPLKLKHELQVHQVELEMQNAELRQTRDDLEAALEKYTGLYEFAPIGYFTLDRKGTILSVNLTGANLVGTGRSQLVGRHFGIYVTPEAHPAFDAFLDKVFADSAKESCEAVLLRDGMLPLNVMIEGVVAESGMECHLALIDITERRRAEESLRLEKEAAALILRAKEAAEALLLAEEAATTVRLEEEAAKVLRLAKEAAEALLLAEKAAKSLRLEEAASKALRVEKEAAEATALAKSQFLVNMSHELRTPMTGILGMLQLTLEEDLAPLTRDYLETTLSSARSLLRILNDILDMAKLEAGKLVIEEQPFSLKACINEAVDSITPEVRRKGIDLAISVAEEVVEIVVGDKMRIQQVFTNLIGNSVKFTEGGKVSIRVAAGAISNRKRNFTFTVTDTGIGIPDDKKALLFRSFSQVDPSLSRKYGGTGLGLAISKDIVELMGGTISFVSKKGVGSAFTFTIPLAEAIFEPEVLPTAEMILPSEVISNIQEGESIPQVLLAEDDPTIRQVLGLMLKRSNYHIDIAENGLKALEMWEKGEYDIVLMDVQMPRLNGFETTQAIREKERERGGHTPIVAMTAHASKEDRENCLAAGMDAFISKPIDFKMSLQVIKETLLKKV